MRRLNFILLLIWCAGIAFPTFSAEDGHSIFGTARVSAGSTFEAGEWRYGSRHYWGGNMEVVLYLKLGLPNRAFGAEISLRGHGFWCRVNYFDAVFNLVACSFFSAVLMAGSCWLARRRRHQTG